MPNLPNWNTGSWGTGYGGNPVPSMFVPQQYANLSSLEAMFPGPASPFTANVSQMALGPADYAELRAMGQQRLMSNVLNQYAADFEPLNSPKPSGLFSRPPTTGSAVVPYEGGFPGRGLLNPSGNSLERFMGSQRANPYTPPTAGALGAGEPTYQYQAPGQAADGGSWAGRGARANQARWKAQAQAQGASTGPVPGSGRPSTPPPGSGRPSTPPPGTPTGQPLPTRTPGTPGPTYGNVNMGAGAGAPGTPTPTPTPTPGPGYGTGPLLPPSRWGAFRTSQFGPSFQSKSPLGDLFTKNMTGKGAAISNIGMQVALQALPRLTAQYLPGITGRPLTEQGVETARSSAGLAGLGAMFGVPVGAAAGVGGFLGDAIGSSGGLGVANFLRENMPEWMPGDVEKQGPTDDTIGDILGRMWGVGGWFSDNGDPAQQQAQDPIAALPPTPESIATVGQMAGLDPSSIGFLQQQFDGSMALARATYAADPEGSKKQFESLYGRPMESEDDLAQVLFSKIVQESLPAALENQSAQAAALQNAAMYQDFISQYMAPIRDQYNDLGAQAAAAGYGDLALQFQGQGVSQEAAMRAIPNLEALKAKQAQVNQLAQAQWQSSMSGTGSTGTDPLGDASTLAALGVPTG